MSIKVYHLPTTSLALGSPFDDSRKIEELDFGVIVLNDSRNASKRGEFI